MEVLEALGAVTALSGSAVLAAGARHARYGFALYLASNVCWIAFAVRHDIAGLLVMQLGFSAMSLTGLWRWRAPVRQHWLVRPLPTVRITGTRAP